MDLEGIRQTLHDLPVGEIRFLPTIGSTNLYAAEWLARDAADFSLVIADEQTEGRGRGDRRWQTPAGTAIALSLILRHPPNEPPLDMQFYAGLASVSVCQVLMADYHVEAALKWPNDVLVGGRKVCGVLVSAHWIGPRPHAVIVGIGVNVLRGSFPQDSSLDFPATSLEEALGAPVDRTLLLRRIVEKCLDWRPRLGTPEFLHAWRAHLAYQGRKVRLQQEGRPDLEGVLRGLDDRAHLLLETADGRIHHLHSGEIHLRPFVDTTAN